MPLKLVPPRDGKSPNWTIRGTYLRVRVDQTAGTPDRRVAARKLARIREDIERGDFSRPGAPTFASAALDYIDAGGEKRFVLRLAEHFGALPLEKIDQAAINKAAIDLYPDATPATRNRQVHSPASAVLKHAGIETKIKRPKGWRGKKRPFWLRQDDLFAILEAAERKHQRFAALLTFLTYCGTRLSEALRLTWADVELPRAFAYLPETKNGDGQPVHLPPVVVAVLANLPKSYVHPIGKGEPRAYKTVFGLVKAGRLYELLDDVCEAAGVTIPPGVAFRHAFGHTYGAWMRRYAGVDTSGLVATGRWKDRDAAEVYEHAEASEEARKADVLPVRRPTLNP